MFERRFRPWETAALLSLCLTLLWGCWANARQRSIASGLVRLHVIAASDEEAEQALKLRVRDAVLAYLRPVLSETKSAEDARALLRQELPALARTAQAAAEGRSVRLILGREDYPLRRYGGFSLPAGRYESLRVVLGEGEGQNWWCVIFPTLCLDAGETEALEAALGPEDYAFITGEEGFSLRFRLVELWGELLSALR